MKHITITTLLSTALVAVFALSASAQPIGPGIAFGLKGGGNLANFYGDAVGNVDGKLRGIGGAYLKIRFNSVLSFQPEALYAQKGPEQTELMDFGGTIGTITGEWQYDHIEIPVLLDFTVPTAGGIAPHSYAGSTISILSSAKIKGDGLELDIKDFTKGTDFSLNSGGGIDMGGSGLKFVLDLRYEMGLTEFDDVGLNEIFLRKHNTIAFMGGLQFGG